MSLEEEFYKQIRRENMVEYNKIDAVYERDMDGTKKLIPGKFRNPTVEYLAKNQWMFTEKIDGTNIRVHWDGHKVEFGGRTESAQIPAKLVTYLNATFGGNTNEEIFEQKFGENEVILFGEGYGPGIQKGGGLYRKEVSFILFDVMVGIVTIYAVRLMSCWQAKLKMVMNLRSLLGR